MRTLTPPIVWKNQPPTSKTVGVVSDFVRRWPRRMLNLCSEKKLGCVRIGHSYNFTLNILPLTFTFLLGFFHTINKARSCEKSNFSIYYCLLIDVLFNLYKIPKKILVHIVFNHGYRSTFFLPFQPHPPTKATPNRILSYLNINFNCSI